MIFSENRYPPIARWKTRVNALVVTGFSGSCANRPSFLRRVDRSLQNRDPILLVRRQPALGVEAPQNRERTLVIGGRIAEGGERDQACDQVSLPSRVLRCRRRELLDDYDRIAKVGAGGFGTV